MIRWPSKTCVRVCVGGEHDGAVKVTEWQKTYYTTDSGIQSGATTVRADDDGTEYSKKYTYTTMVTENPAGEKHKRITYFNCFILYWIDLFYNYLLYLVPTLTLGAICRYRIANCTCCLAQFVSPCLPCTLIESDSCNQILTRWWIFLSTAVTLTW